MTFASILLSTAMLATAQNPPYSNVTPEVAARLAAGDGPGQPANSMAEHIEIFRQILRRKLHFSGLPTSTHNINPQPGQGMTNYYAPSSTSNTLWSYDNVSGTRAWPGEAFEPSLEGVYLPGYGVVVTVTMPASSRDNKPAEDKPATKPISDWERAQMELRGEKPAVAPAQVGARPPSVRDIILRVLAENGQHLSRLRDDERLTVVVTFREGGRYAGTVLGGALADYVSQGSLASTITNRFSGQQSRLAGNLAPTASGLTQPAIVAPAQSAAGKPPSSARDYELLADLHLKQQQYQAAVEAYAKALATIQEEAQKGDSANLDERLILLYSRQAQAELGLGHNDRAIELLRKAQARPKTAEGAAAPAAKGAAKPSIASKLIISASKRQLDQVAQGKMTFEEFRKAASIDEE
jgi:hypothetical protein